MRLNGKLRSLVLAAAVGLVLLPETGVASRFALGYQWEDWGTVDLDKSPNPDASKIGDKHYRFNIEAENWYFEEPGFIFSLIAGMAQSEANEVDARNEAIRKGEGTYRWSYATPPPIPTGRWFRWGYSKGRTVGAENDSNVIFLYRRYDMNLVTAPRLIGNSDYYWMIGSKISGTSLKMYPRGAQPGDDWSFMDTPMEGYLGWQPRFFPWLMAEGFVGIDFIDLLGPVFLGWDNYSPFYSVGTKVSLGVDWLSVYGSFYRKQDPLYAYGSYSRRYVGNWFLYGARLDIGNLVWRLMGLGKP